GGTHRSILACDVLPLRQREPQRATEGVAERSRLLIAARGALRERADLGAHPAVREAVRVRPAGRVGRDDGDRDVELLDLPRQAVAMPVRVVLRRRAEQDLVAGALLDDAADRRGGVGAAVDELHLTAVCGAAD